MWKSSNGREKSDDGMFVLDLFSWFIFEFSREKREELKTAKGLLSTQHTCATAATSYSSPFFLSLSKRGTNHFRNAFEYNMMYRSALLKFRGQWLIKHHIILGHWLGCNETMIAIRQLFLSPLLGPGPFPCGFPKIGISQKSGFRAFLGISRCFYGDFKCPRASEIHIICLKSR